MFNGIKIFEKSSRYTIVILVLSSSATAPSTVERKAAHNGSPYKNKTVCQV